MKKVFHLLASLLLITTLSVKASVDADTTIIVNGTEHGLSVTIPSDYDPLISYPLIIGLHYCGGSSDEYRDALRPLCDSLNIIIACPGNSGQQMSDPDFILASIDTAKSNYTIDTTQVFLTGMSCNGVSVLQMGLNSIYPFKGIFPWVPYFSSFTNATFNLDSEMPIVISVGTDDSNYGAILRLYDSLASHEASVDLVLVQGIGHILAFSEFSNEMTRCMWYLNDTNAIIIESVADFSMINTDPAVEIKVPVTNIAGRALHFRTLSSANHVISPAEVSMNETNDTATFMIDPVDNQVGRVFIVLEGTEEGGTGIEQMVFHIAVQGVPVSMQTEESTKGIEVYPIPASSQLFLKCQETEVSVQVINMEGKTVLKKDPFNTSSALDISSLPEGVYLLAARNANFEGSVRFVIQ